MSTNNNIRITSRFGIARRQFLLTALALLAAITLITAFTATAASAKAGDRPFKGVMVNNDSAGIPYAWFHPVTGKFHLRIDVDISGEINATHLGKGEVEGLASIDFWPVINGDPSDGFCSNLIEGAIDFTAANGDVVNMVMTLNQLCPISPTAGVFTGQYDVIGGTGRFSGADGVIDVSAILDLTSGSTAPSVNTLSGTIVY